MSAPRITLASWAMIGALGLTWGGTFLVTELGLRGLSPFWLAAGRIGFAAIVMVAIWGLRGWRLFDGPPPPSARAALLAIGALSSTVPFCLLAWGQQYVTAGFAGVSMASVALIVLPLAHLFVPGERMHLRRTIGFLIGFAGVCVLIGGAALDSTGAARETAGRIACITAAGCYGVSSILMRRLPPVDPIGLATLLLLIGAALALPVAWAVEGPPPLPDRDTLLIVAFLGLVPTAAANFLRVLVIRTAGPVFMSLTNYQVPLWSVLLGAWLLDEPLPPTLLGAMALILGGVALSQWGALRRLFGRG
ncbi:MAG: DMT family transporter [Pseudomonadota bacterium]